MSLRIPGAISALAVILASSASAQPPAATGSQEGLSASRANPASIAPGCRASQILGSKVRNAQGEDLGTIEDLVLDDEAGSVAYAVLSFGGFLGMGDKLYAIPFGALRKAGEEQYVLDVDKDQLTKAPGFDKDHWPNVADRTWGADIHRYYNQRPYWERLDYPTPNLTFAAQPLDMSRIQEFEGTIVRLSSSDGPDSFWEVTLKTDDRKLSVHVAPDAYLQAKHLDLSMNDKIRIRGVVLESTGVGHNQVVATEITKGDQVLVLRKEDGTPIWTDQVPDPRNPNDRRNARTPREDRDG